MPKSRKPTVGAIVHYFTGDREHAGGQLYHAAIITRVHTDDVVNLRVFFDMERATGIRQAARLLGNERNSAGWRWPTD
jgi:hypothetical protein